VRIQIDTVLELDDPTDTIPIGSDWIIRVQDAIGRSIAEEYPELDGKGSMGPLRLKLTLDMRDSLAARA
jgi:hypothetical protein